jgi:uncharacterized protein YeaC (DUF1315 family)
MDFESAAEAINSDIYSRFKLAIELGRWPDGRELTKAQKEICLQAIILYETKHQVADEQRVGYVDSTKKTSPCGPKGSDEDTSTIRILN